MSKMPVFVHASARIDRTFDEVESHFVASPANWLPSVVGPAFETGEGVRARVGLRKQRVTKEVLVRVGEAFRSSSRTVLPIRVEATAATALFPQLDADLEITPVGPDATDFTLNGSYRPPLGAVGALLDRAVLHKVAEAAVKNLVERAAKLLHDAHLPSARR